jgi:hypothetical protein
MPTFSAKKTPNLESAAPKKGKTKPSAPSRRKPISGAPKPKKAPPQPVVSKAARIAAAKTPDQGEGQSRERITKQELMLTLLSQPDGASIREMMQATHWQQHSVRGFLAGTVKKSSVLCSPLRSQMTGSAATTSRRGAAAEMTKPSINLAEELARLSAATIFELRGE